MNILACVVSQSSELTSHYLIMVKTVYVAVFWAEENSYSHVKISKVSFNTELVKNYDDLIGVTCEIDWDGRLCMGRVDGYGSKKKMEALVYELSQKAAEESFLLKEDHGCDLVVPNNSGSCALGQNEVFSADEVVDALRENMESTLERERVNDKERRILELEAQLASEKNKVTKLQRMLRKRPAEEESDSNTSLGNGILVSSTLLALLQTTLACRPSVFLRRLMVDSGVFTLEEIANSSVKGKKCRFMKQSRPALDPNKFLPLKAYVISSCSLKPNTLEMEKFEQKVATICSDARKKIKSLGAGSEAFITN